MVWVSKRYLKIRLPLMWLFLDLFFVDVFAEFAGYMAASDWVQPVHRDHLRNFRAGPRGRSFFHREIRVRKYCLFQLFTSIHAHLLTFNTPHPGAIF